MVQKMAMVLKLKKFLGKLEEGLFCFYGIYVNIIFLFLNMKYMSMLVGYIVIFCILLLR